MKLEFFQIDSFTDKLFGGNPAGVVPLTSWLPDELLLKIARENAVAETAFFILKNNSVDIRWFTPDLEMDLCGHATLATAHVLKEHLNFQPERIVFESKSGELIVTKNKENYTLDLPSRMPVKSELPEVIRKGIGQPIEVLKSRDYILVFENEEDIVNMKPDRKILDQINLDPGGICVTAKGRNVDFVSRFFTPQSTLFEDPVTGSAHCSLIPYWSNRLNKNEMTALQLSERIGKLHCVNAGSRVLISGQAKTYLVGTIFTE
jgi:PhzF family phenazine biosynthesis protein